MESIFEQKLQLHRYHLSYNSSKRKERFLRTSYQSILMHDSGLKSSSAEGDPNISEHSQIFGILTLVIFFRSYTYQDNYYKIQDFQQEEDSCSHTFVTNHNSQ